MNDLLIKNARIVDGTGRPAFSGEVAVADGRIVHVGKAGSGGTARRVIDAAGRLLTPGFVDIHTHYDAQATWDEKLTPSSWHGCTTVVFGSCGVGFAPAHPARHEWLIGLMEGVEDIPGAALTEGIQWEWESFDEYLDALSRRAYMMDIGAQVPHGALRAYVMGERGANNEEATADDVDQMRAVLLQGLKAGALGFSTSRTLLHKSRDGDPVPGTFAGERELFGLGHALREAGHGVFQVAGEHHDMRNEIKWMKALAMEMGRPVSFNLSQTYERPGLWREVLSDLEDAVADGAPLIAQVAGRSIGVLMCWQGTAHPFIAKTAYCNVGWLDWEERKAKLHDPEVKKAILEGEHLDVGPLGNLVTQSLDKTFIVDDAFDYEPAPEQSVAAIAARTGRTAQEVAYEAMMRDDGTGMLYFPLFNYAGGDLEILHTLHGHPATRMGLSDAGAHCGAICDGGMPTFMLTHWARDRSRGPRFSLEHIVYRQTKQTAELFGLLDRGVIAPGYRADFNVIDLDALAFDKPEMAFDLPSGGRRLVQGARGYAYTICAGTVVSEDGAPTGALPGRLMRGPQTR